MQLGRRHDGKKTTSDVKKVKETDQRCLSCGVHRFFRSNAGDAAKGAISYDYNATLCDPDSGNYPGVYETALTPKSASDKDAPTIGMPSIADGNLDKPTTESPAIILGAAVVYEEKTGPVDYKTLKDRVEPYTEFKVDVVEETAQDGSVHKKLTGFDGTYVIVRLDVSEFYSVDIQRRHSREQWGHSPESGSL